MADVPGKFYRATKVRTGVSPSSAGSIEGEPLPPVNPPGSSLNSVGLTMPSAFTVSNSPLTANGTIGVAGAGTVAQYIRGDGSLADFPESSGGGGSVNYYLNGSVDQGTIGGVAYKEINKVPILGAGTQFSISADGYIASFLTDAGDPNLLEIPGGNWNFETYFSSSSSGGTPTFYVELYKYDGTTFTLIASSVTSPEFIAFGTTLTPYFSTLAVPTTTLALTDRLAIRYYVTHSGRTITMHTENNTLCQIITTFTTGLTALNGLTAQVQNFAVGTTGTDFNIASAVSTHTFNLPTASATNRGALSSADWALFTQAYNDKINSAAVTGTTTKTLTLTQQDGGTITASWSDLNTDAVLSVFGRTGNVIAANGDYTTAQVTESGNLYFTQARVSANTDVAANTAARHNAVTIGTANGLSLSTQVLSLGLASAGITGALSGTDWSTFNSKQAQLNGTGFVKVSGTTISYDNTSYLPLTGGTLTGPLGGTSISLSGDITANRYRGVNSLVLNTYTTVNPSSNVYLYSPPNDKDAWIYLDSADTGSNWGIYHRQIDTAVSGLPANSIGFIGGGTNTLQAWISLQTGNGFFAGSLTAANLSGTNTGNVTIGTANGLSLSGQVLSLGLASGSANGALSSTDWTTFNNKQNALTNPVTGTGTTNYLPKFTGSTTIGNSQIFDNGSFVGINTTTFGGRLSISESATTAIRINSGSGLNAISIGGTGIISVDAPGVGGQRFTLLDNGNAGFGTNAPSGASGRTLVVNGTTGQARFALKTDSTGDGSGDGLQFVVSGIDASIEQRENASLDFATNAEGRMRITAGGNVYIGTGGAALQSTERFAVSSANNTAILAKFVGGSEAGWAAKLWNDAAGNNNLLLEFATDTSITARGSVRYDRTGNRLNIVGEGNGLLFTGAATFSSSVTANKFFVNTSGQSREISTFYGAGSAGENIWIGGGGLNSTTGGGASSLGSNNTSLGVFALEDNTTGYGNTAVGYLTLPNNTSGNSNTAVGQFSMNFNTTGYINAAFGTTSLYNNTTGYGNAAFGTDSLRFITTGRENTGIGNQAGAYINSGANNSTSENSVYIGADSRASANGNTNEIVIGFSARGQGSNSAVIGNSSITKTFLNGNVAIGPNTPNYKLNVFDTGVVISSGTANWSTNTRGIMVDNTNNGDESVGIWFRTGTNHLSGISGQRRDNTAGWGTDLRFYTHEEATVNLTTATERMRITTSGNLLVGATTTIGPAAGRIDVLYSGLTQYGMNIRSSHTDGIAISFVNSSGTQVGTIYQNGSSTAYNTSSDYRLKEDLKDFNGIDLINKIKTYDFKWKSDNSRSYGVVAHELQEVINYAVFGQKDSLTMQGVDYSKLVPILIKAIQEQQVQIDKLKN
jgi:hypothetical protein